MKGHFLIIGVLLLVVSVLITLNIFFQQSLQMEIAEQFNEQQQLISKSIADNIAEYIHFLKEDVLSIVSILSKMDIRNKNGFEWLEKNVIRNKMAVKRDIKILNSRGDIVFTQDDENSRHPIPSEILRLIKDQAPDSINILETSSTLYITSPVYRQNMLKNIIVLSVRINDIANHFITDVPSESKDSEDRNYVCLIDKNGNLLYHPARQSEIGKNILKTDPACLKCHLNFKLEKMIIEGKTKNKSRYIAPFGQDKILAFSPVNIHNLLWTVIVSAHYSEATRTTQQSMKFYSYLIISILITTILVSTALIAFNKKRIQAKEIAKRQKAMEKYAIALEEQVNKRTEELLSEKEKLNTIVSAIGSGIILFNKEGEIQWANQMVKEKLGSDVIGMPCDELFSECEVSGPYSLKDDVETVIMSNMFGQKGKYFQVITAPVKGENGEVHGYIQLIQDVTELKRMEEQMTNSEKLASIGRLAAGIAHEIGNPLTSIFSFVQILREIEQEEFKKDSLKTISFHINRISEILKQLSGFSKMPIGEPRQCQINEIIESSINLIQYDKKAKEIDIIEKLSPSLPEVSIDCNQLSQVFVNLILNAIDAMPNGGELTVKSFVKRNNIVIQFKDQGLGIPKENLIKIFDPFYTTKEKGTGLGLAVSYNIVKKMNGTLTVESEVNKGSTFTITIPIKERSET
jgi:PAS domain S-box-containing protein